MLAALVYDGLHWGLLAVCFMFVGREIARFHKWLGEEKSEALELATRLESKLGLKKIPAYLRLIVCGRFLAARELREKEIMPILDNDARLVAEMEPSALIVVEAMYAEPSKRTGIDEKIRELQRKYLPAASPPAKP